MYSSQPPQGIALDDLISGSQALRNKQVRAARATTMVDDLGPIQVHTCAVRPGKYSIDFVWPAENIVVVAHDPERFTAAEAVEIVEFGFRRPAVLVAEVHG